MRPRRGSLDFVFVVAAIAVVASYGCGETTPPEVRAPFAGGGEEGGREASSGGRTGARRAASQGHDATPGVDAKAPGVDAKAPGVDAKAPGVDAKAPGVDAATAADASGGWLAAVPAGWTGVWGAWLHAHEALGERFAQARQIPGERRLITARTHGSSHIPGHGHLAPGEVALTFDDGPHPHFTPQVLDLLDRHGVKATFFIVGVQAKRYPEILHDIVERGHTIATHTYKHPFLTTLSLEDAEWQMKEGRDATLRAAGETHQARVTRFFRYPGGKTNSEINKAQRGLGLISFHWNISGRDSFAKRHAKAALKRRRERATEEAVERVSRELIVSSVLEGIERHRRGIILLHDTHQRSVDALAVILDELAIPRRLEGTAKGLKIEKFKNVQFIGPKSHPASEREKPREEE